MYCMKYEAYKELLKARLTKYRYHHSKCVAKEARRLAEKYGADPEQAYLAGLLHDICKDETKENQLQMMEKFGIILSDVEKSAPKLWHAMTGAEYLRQELAITDSEILSAVRYHTTARRDMSLLEKILYLADFTSADREYPDVEEMRRLVDISLQDALQYALQYTIGDLANAGCAIHPATLDAYNQVILQK